MLFKDIELKDINAISNNLVTGLNKSNTVQEAAHKFVTEIYSKFKESVILLRLYISIPMNELPKKKRDLANNFARQAGFSVPLNPESFILTLFGSVEKESGVSESNGHQAIPLASADFVTADPMMNALLDQLGFDLGWIRGEKELVAQAISKMNGIFYVPNASETVNKHGRYVIADQNYVNQYGIKTVFGFGGGYTNKARFLTCICFTNESFDKEKARLFTNLVDIFREKTITLLDDNTKLF